MIELKSAVCPECGGRLVIDPLSPSSGKCQSCGYTTLIAGVPGFTAEKAAWINAIHQMEDGETDRADKFFKQIIETRPDYGEAYFGRFECAIAVAEYYKSLNRNMARCLPDYVEALQEALNKYAKRALQYAPDEDTKQTYQQRVDEVIKIVKDIIEPPTPPQKRGFWDRLFG